ncbi:MAG: response regulator [Lewinellaceae bacterium]|nr:response regulator [Saprospiraceae bacterium]MCB9336501.1 response regulator [Lewinellaceae bacterium]
MQRFDGQKFTTFLHNSADSNSMASNHIAFLEIEADGKLLIGFNDVDILDRFNPATGTFAHEKLGSRATVIGRCQNGDSWMGNGSGLWLKEKDNAEPKIHSFPPHPKHSLSAGIWVFDIVEDKNGDVWVGTKRGVYKIGKNGSPGDWWLPCDDQFIGNDTTFSVRKIVEDRQGKLWFATEKGLFVQSGTDRCLTPFRMPENTALPFEGQEVPSIALNPQGQLWLCTKSEGIYRLHPHTQDLLFVPPHTKHGNKIRLSYLAKLFVDNQGAIWMLSTNMGVHVYHPNNQHFQWFNEANALILGQPSPSFQMVLEDSKNHLWRLSNGVEVEGYPALNQNVLESLLPGYAISEAPGGIFWLSSAKGKVKRIDSNTGKVQSFIEDPYSVGSTSYSNYPSAECVDRNGNFWAGFWGGGAAYFDEKDLENPKLWSCKYKDPDVPLGCAIQAILESKDGKVWFGSAGEGLAVFNPTNNSWKAYRKGDKENELQHGYVRCLLEDQAGMIWLGTYGGGVFRFDPGSETFTPFNRGNGLPDDLIEEIIEDHKGYIWIVSSKTLTRLDPVQGTFQTFDQEDGLPETNFNRMTYAKNGSGRMFLATGQGYVVFHPDSIRVDTVPPNTAIVKMSRYRIDGQGSKPIEVGGIAEKESIELSYKDYIVTFEFAAITFQKAPRTTIEYKLEGFQNDWIQLDGSRQVSFTSLPAGSYQLLVRSANADGYWDKTPATLRIIVSPPWWKTWWAYSFYALAVMAAFWFLRRRELRRIHLQNQLEKEYFERARLEELDQVRSHFLTNISHEFRTPLTVILGMTEEIEEPKSAKNLIRKSGENLLRLVNQLLDFGKLEAGKLELQPQSGNLVTFLNYLLESFHSLAEHKNVQLVFEPSQEHLIMDFDEEKMQHIVSNLLSNAIKFTPRDGKVTLSVARSESNVTIQVKDTGIGIAADQLPRIFERFYQISDPMSKGEPGTGIGLTFTKELVELMDGKIEVESVEGEGSVFRVTLPVRQSSVRQFGSSTAHSSTVSSPAIEPDTGRLGTDELRTDELNTGELSSLLLIEDNPEVVAYIRTILHEEYDIMVAENGAIGIEKAIESIPDVIISDVMMPVKDGFAVTQFLKNDERTSHIPIILLTAKADAESRLEGLERGADAYLAKPFDKKELRLRLEKLIELRKKLQARYAQFAPLQQSDDIGLQIEDAFLQKLNAIIEANLGEAEFNVNELCNEMLMSRSQLFRKLKALTDKSIVAYLRSARLHKARELLQTGELNVTEVAFEVGFNDPKYFSRAFSQEFGYAPKELG